MAGSLVRQHHGLFVSTLLYDLTLVTRNIAEIADTGVRYLDPFAAASG